MLLSLLMLKSLLNYLRNIKYKIYNCKNCYLTIEWEMSKKFKSSQYASMIKLMNFLMDS